MKHYVNTALWEHYARAHHSFALRPCRAVHATACDWSLLWCSTLPQGDAPWLPFHDRGKRFLGHFNSAKHPHLLLALLLLLQEFLLTAYISTVALGGYVFAHRFYSLPCNHPSFCGCLYCYIVLLPADGRLEPAAHVFTLGVRLRLVYHACKQLAVWLVAVAVVVATWAVESLGEEPQ